MRNARVRDQRPTEGRFADLNEWFEEIGKTLDQGGPAARAITRYATPASAPASPEAAHALLAVDPASFEPVDGNAPLVVNDYGGVVSPTGDFRVVINDQPVQVHIRWENSIRRFEVTSATSIPYRANRGAGDMFWQHITRHQALRVATSDRLVFANGNFWSLVPNGRSAATGLLSVLSDRTELDNVIGEKGDINPQGRWDADTVFGLVDDVFLPAALGDDATILCTDMGREIADFIGITDTKAIFVHAKSKSAAKPSKVSGSALHEVVSQAVKNLKYLTMGNDDTPNTRSWSKEWIDGTHGPANRHRRGTVSRTGAAYWKRINAVVQSHGSEREVWLVLGACLSKSALQNDLAKRNPSAPAVQAYGLLNSVWSASQQCGVRLRVICSP